MSIPIHIYVSRAWVLSVAICLSSCTLAALRSDMEGVVTLASQPRPAAQAWAQLLMGFDEDHAPPCAGCGDFARLRRVDYSL